MTDGVLLITGSSCTVDSVQLSVHDASYACRVLWVVQPEQTEDLKQSDVIRVMNESNFDLIKQRTLGTVYEDRGCARK